MVSVGQVVSKTVGIAGIGVAMFDAARCSKMMGRHQAEVSTANWLENAYYNSRTLDNISASSNMLRKKTFDIKSNSPIPALIGKTKGTVAGFLYGLGINLPTILCSAVAILTKGTVSKVAAAGVALTVLYKIVRDGFGLGKQHPMR